MVNMQFTEDSVEMDQNVAQHLFHNNAVLIITGVPIGTEFGVDLSSYEVGERFRGIKMIPPGPHFVFCAAKDVYGFSAPRVGFIHYFKPAEIVVREWDAKNEELRFRQSKDSELEMRRIRENLMDLDRFLAPYDFQNLSQWRCLTDTITEVVLDRCSPRCGFVRNSIEFLSCPDSERPRGGLPSTYRHTQNTVDENDLLPSLKALPETALNFTDLPPKIPRGASATELTMHSLDCIKAIDSYFDNFSDPNEAIQEIQLAFILFCSGHSLDALSHWRRTLNLLSNSESAVNTRQLFYMKYLETLQYQLPELPEELMGQSKMNTVYRDVRSLLQNCSIAGLHVSADRMVKRLKKSMKWTFEGLLDDDPEDMPVVVETTADS